MCVSVTQHYFEMYLGVQSQLLITIFCIVSTHSQNSVLHDHHRILAQRVAEDIINAKKLIENQNACAFYMISSSESSTVSSTVPHMHKDQNIPLLSTEIACLGLTYNKEQSPRFTHSFPCEIFVFDASILVTQQGERIARLGRSGKNVFFSVGQSEAVSWSDGWTHIKWKFYLHPTILHSKSVIYDTKITKQVKTGRINLAGSHLAVSGLAVPPYMLLDLDRKVIGGTFVQLFQVASTFYNFSYEVSSNRKPTGAL